MNIEPKLTLVGAGPGDADLITLKGIHALAEADVVLYDALVDISLLNYAPSDAPKVYVGKRKGQHSFQQAAINDLIVQYAQELGHVVRLKGGDPFVLGRGYEEIQHAQQFGIPTAVVPGVSSSTGVPSALGFPLTHRGVSRGFWVLTATASSGKLLEDIQLAAQTDTTLVILMGLHKLKDIVAIYTQLNKLDTPIAILQEGTLPTQQVVVGSMLDIEALAASAQVQAPAILLVGEVVKLSTNYAQLSAYLTLK
ncbi:MAG: uroporphyrinogen-III C-methyltransferase [Thermonemataceae bacterium]